jgi:hypothetical protein
VDALSCHLPVTGSVLRWAIGSSDGPRSSAWRLWGNKKGDIYIANRSLGDMIKASFHRDGKCQVGFTSEYAPTAAQRFGCILRHWEKWVLPSEPVVRILQVLIPHSELRSFTTPDDREITWLPVPPEGSIAVVSVFVTTPGIERLLPSADHPAIVVGKVPTCARTAWLVYANNPLDAASAKLVDEERTKLKQIPGAQSVPPGTRAAVWESRQDHDRHVLELACD